MRRIVLPALLVMLAALDAGGQSPALRMHRIFGDGMVLQRDARISVKGWAAPGRNVVVVFRGDSAAARADGAGAWRVELPAAPPGGPHELSVSDGSTRLTLRDVLVGDVWVASGQSNMEWRVVDARDAAREIATARDSSIRHFKVPMSWSWNPEQDLVGGRWWPADSAHVRDFTAVGYFFARALRAEVGVPIGIVNTSWGGSSIQPWISLEGLQLDPLAWNAIQARERLYQKTIRDSIQARLQGMPTVDGGLVAGRALWASPDLRDATWGALPVPSPWENAGFPGMDGVVWYRTSFTLTAAEAAQGVSLALGAIDDEDITWVNGVEVGRTSGWNKPRKYAVPATALRAGRNVVAARVTDGGGGGGLIGPASDIYVDVGGSRRPLPGSWKFKVGVVSLGDDGQHINKIPTVLYNRMVHPLLDFPIKGVIWYQGESNANNVEQAAEYRGQFRTMIERWRAEWRGNGGASFPFLWVQLPNWGPRDTVPPRDAAWATLRESQDSALALPNTGQVVAIDIGDWDDLHPRNKQDVGARLALAARAVAYGQRLDASGPRYRSHEVAGGRVTIRLDHASGLTTRMPGDSVAGFAIAGEDGRFVWARARIEGDGVVVWSDAIAAPVAVRYAWGNSPAKANVVNRAGLPMAPFRTDAW